MPVILVTGSRNLREQALVFDALTARAPDLVLVGDCPDGADRFARAWCLRNGVRAEIYCASREPHDWPSLSTVFLVSDWRVDGRKAGPLRNAPMVKRAAELGASALAFPRGGPGTAGCIRLARAAGLSVTEL
jgi:hypothetical protein